VREALPGITSRWEGRIAVEVRDMAGAEAAAGLIDGINACVFTTIVFLFSMLAYLGLYNLMFILALVAVLIVAYQGVKSEVLGRPLRRHLAAVKLAMAVLFAGLGSW